MLLDLNLSELSEKLQKKEISAVDLIKESLTQIQRLDPQLHGFINVKNEKLLYKEAEKADELRTKNSSPLLGLPFSLKDAYCTSDITTTAGSEVLDNFIPPYDATVYKKIKQAGAILIGKNNQDAWGHGGSTENTDYQAAKNPWNTDYIPGGSSGGSAIAVATRMVSFAIGEDTGGSIRNPASMCNISGLKVTYGRVSRYGAIAYASSLDTVGPMAKSVKDLALLLEFMAGSDSKDGTSSHRPVDQYTQFTEQSIKGKIIGLPEEFFTDGLDKEVKQIVRNAAAEFEKLGAKVEIVSIPLLKYGIAIYYLIALSETNSNLARYNEIRFGSSREKFSEETKRRIMTGAFALSAGYSDELYKNAQKARTLLINEYQKAFTQCDILLAPVVPNPPLIIGELVNDSLRNYLEDLYTATVNVVGVPSLAIPAGFTKTHLPVGIQLIGKKFAEGELFSFGAQYQRITNWHQQKPLIIE